MEQMIPITFMAYGLAIMYLLFMILLLWYRCEWAEKQVRGIKEDLHEHQMWIDDLDSFNGYWEDEIQDRIRRLEDAPNARDQKHS